MICYEIIVEGRLMSNRLKDFEGLCASPLPEGMTALRGYLADQAALFAVLNRIRDMNLPLWQVLRYTEKKGESL